MSKELISAISEENFERVKKLVREGSDLSFRDQHGNNILAFGSLEMTKLLLALGADPQLPTYNNHSMVGNAAFFGDYAKVELLVNAGADPNQIRPETGESPLHLATCKFNKPGTTECVRILLEYGADPNLRTLIGIGSDCFNGNLWVVAETPLHRAASYGEIKMIQYLLDHKADISLKDCYGYIPLDWAARMWRNHEILRLLGGSV